MRIILLLGASSSGKSTLCNGVQAATNPQWKIRDTDTFANHCVNQAIAAFSKVHDVQGLLSELEMSPDKIVDFAMTGKLQPGKNKDGDDSPAAHQFGSPELTNVDQVLKKFHIEDARIPILADELRNVIKYQAELVALLPEPNQEFLNRFFEDIFNEAFEPDDTLIIDVNPHPEVGPLMISELIDQHIKRFSEKEGLSIESFKVLAYCPLDILSERIQRRIKNKKDDEYMGDGIFPFQQVAMLVSYDCSEEKKPTAQKHTKRDNIGDLSRKSVFDIASRHTEHIDDEPLVIVDTTDPTALKSPKIEDCESEISVVAPKSVVEAYHDLTDKFGFHASDNRIKLGICNNVQYDVIIDTSKQDVSDLVDEINNLTQMKAATRHF